MKKLLINAESEIDIEPVLRKAIKEANSKNIAIATTIQHLKRAKQIRHPYIKSVSQIIGCNTGKKPKAEKIIYLGSGEFHPIELAIQTEKEIIIANPYNNSISKITKHQINLEKVKIKGKLLKFHSAEKIGILVSTKPGQYNMKRAREIKNKLEKPSYIFLFNTLKKEELENFPQIDIWINTACPRIESNKIINERDLKGTI